MKINNYKILFFLRILKSILNTFIDVFLVLYFLKLSNNNIVPLGIYQLVSMTVVFLVMVLTRNYCKTKKRIRLLRIGIILYFIYFLAIILLKEKVIEYIYLIGIIYGLEEGFYYSIYNTIESDGVKNDERTKFLGVYTASKYILSIILPLIFGFMIKYVGFINASLFAAMIVVLEIILSFIFKDNNIPKSQKFNLKNFIKTVKKHKVFKNVLFTKICSGLTYSSGALSYVIAIYIIKVFNESVSLGIFTSIFSIISVIIALLFVKIIKPKYYKTLMITTSTITIILLCTIMINCNFITIVLFNLFQTISKGLTDLINEKNIVNYSNISDIKKEFKIEYFLSLDAMLFIGRVISNSLFILMAFANSNIIMIIFIIFAILGVVSSVMLQINVNKECN